MQENNKKFRTVRFRFETDAGDYQERYMVVDDNVPLFRVNQWLELKAIRKASTGHEYAKKITVFLNWLDSRNISFENATNLHVRVFLHDLIFGSLQDSRIKSLRATVSSSTLSKYIAVITGFYRWLDDICQTEMVWNSKKSKQTNHFCTVKYIRMNIAILWMVMPRCSNRVGNIQNGMTKAQKICCALTSTHCVMKRYCGLHLKVSA